MKTIGLLGGMSWESTVTYYQIINTVVRGAAGGLHSAKWSSTAWISTRLRPASPAGTGREAEICRPPPRLWSGRAPTLSSSAPTPCTRWRPRSPPAAACPSCTSPSHRPGAEGRGGTAALLGPEPWRGFYQSVDRWVRVLIPGEADRVLVNDVIFRELCLGVVSPVQAEFLASLIPGGRRVILAVRDRPSGGQEHTVPL